MARPRNHRNAGGVFINNSGTLKPTPAVSRAFIPASASIPGPPGRYTDEDLQRATKLALELFVKGQEHDQFWANTASRDCLLKARNPNLYYKSLYIECYYFCWQYKDHFDTAGATGHKCIPFAALFLWDRINFHWQQ